jgi:hypothetical protein
MASSAQDQNSSDLDKLLVWISHGLQAGPTANVKLVTQRFTNKAGTSCQQNLAYTFSPIQ